VLWAILENVEYSPTIRLLLTVFSRPSVLTVALLVQCCVCLSSVCLLVWRYVLWLNGAF